MLVVKRYLTRDHCADWVTALDVCHTETIEILRVVAMLTGSSGVDMTMSPPAQDMEFMQPTEESRSAQRQSAQFNAREYSEDENVNLLSDTQHVDENGARPSSTDSESIISSPPSFTTEPPSAIASAPGPSFNHHTDSGLRFFPLSLVEHWRNRVVDVPPAYTEA